jgi:hypothetical protein
MGGGAKQPPQPRPNIAKFRHTTLHSLMLIIVKIGDVHRSLDVGHSRAVFCKPDSA